jgi:beta-N-acetylhexosaminidase
MVFGIEEKIGQLIVVGFHGTSPEDPSVQKLMAQASQGKIGGTILFGYNIKAPDQITTLTAAIHKSAPAPLFLFADQEGGHVQRLGTDKGFEDFLSARQVARTLTRDKAVGHYRNMGRMLQAAGVNFDFAPCVDLNGECPVIGGLERSYSDDPKTVARFAGAMMTGLHQEKILNCIKHYPGHGRAKGDTHQGLVDVTATWSQEELRPFETLIREGRVHSVMTAHTVHSTEDPNTPASFSPKWISRLRQDLGFTGLIIPDDLHMGAILLRYCLEDIVIQGLNAGLDLLLFSNNPLAAKARGICHDKESVLTNTCQVPDEDLPDKIISIALAALKDGRLSMERIDQAFDRVINLKQRLL